MPDDTQDLLASASGGDERALATLLERHLPRLRAFVRLRVGAHLRARENDSDIVQSICRQVLMDAPRFEYRDEPSFRAWLFQAALSKIRDKHQFHTRQKRDVAREHLAAADESLWACYAKMGSPSQGMDQKERLGRFEEVFAKLSEQHRQVITLAKIVGLSHQQIAQEMGKSEGSVRVLLHRGVARLGVMLDEAGE